MEVVFDLDIRLLPFDAFKISELLCKLILIIYRFIVSQNPQYKSYFKKLCRKNCIPTRACCKTVTRRGHVIIQRPIIVYCKTMPHDNDVCNF